MSGVITESGQLGLDKEISRAEEPILIPKFANEPIVRVQVGILNSAAFTGKNFTPIITISDPLPFF